MTDKKRRNSSAARQQQIARIQAVILGVLAVYIFFALVSWHSGDISLLGSNPSRTVNSAGTAGILISEGLFRLLGKGAYLLPLFLISFAVPWYRAADIRRSLQQSAPLLLLLAATVMMLGLARPGDPYSFGLLGKGLLGITLTLTGRFGSWLISIALLGSFLYLFSREPLRIIRQLLQRRSNPLRTPKGSGRSNGQLPGSRVVFEQPPASAPENAVIFKAGLPRKELLRRFKEQALATEDPVPFITKVYIEENTENIHRPATAAAPAGQYGIPADENTLPPEGPVSDPLTDWKHEEPVPVDESAAGYDRYNWQDEPEIKLQNEFPDRYDALMHQAERPDEAPAVTAEAPSLSTEERFPEDLPEEFPEELDAAPPFTAEPEAQAAPPAATAPEEGPRVIRFPAQSGPNRTQVKKTHYRTPDASLLAKSTQEIDDEMRRNMRLNAEILEQTFNEFNIEARVTNISRGPVITRFEISIPPGVKLNRVSALQDNIALNLAAASVRIEAPIPGKSAIGIEIPNKKRSMVTLRDILETAEFRKSRAKIPVALGQTVSGSSMVTDLAAMPHLIIAGTTGSGKSVCVNGIICSILYNMLPDRVRLILVDPKYVELAPYNGIPHLLTPVINKPRAAVQALKWLVGEMERRYLLLQQMSCRNITSFNSKVKEEKPKDPETGEQLEKMPYLVVVIDELADLMLLAAKEIEDSISRLAAMSRAVGIHLIFATQRPSVDVITGVIKNNFPARIAFQVASSTDSRTILDKKGAEKLLGQGDSLFIGPGSPHPQRLQGAFLSEEEVDKTAAWLRSIGEPEYNMDIVKDLPENSDSSAFEDGDSEDELFPEAVDVVISSQRASASYLQRRLKVGYNRAARMIEMMEEEGIIGPPQGSKPREILVSSWDPR